jgi:hypothetical protein
MNHMAEVFVFFHFTALFLFGSASPQEFPELKGDYLGQPPPGLTPEVFAPGIISTDAGEGCSGFMLDGKLFLFRRRSAGMLIIGNSIVACRRNTAVFTHF